MASLNGEEDNTPVQEQSGSLKVESEFPLADYNQEAGPPAPLRTDRSGVEGVWEEDDKQENIYEDSNTTENEYYSTEAHAAVQDDNLPDNDVACMHQILRNSKNSKDSGSSFDRMSLRSLLSSGKSNSIDLDCAECGILNKAMPSEDSKDFWQSVPEVGLSQDRCHVKLWENFENKIKEVYPNADSLKSKQTMAFMKNLLDVNPTSKLATIKYEMYYKLVKFLGPMRSADPVMLCQLHEIVEKSQIKRKVGSGKYEKISWFAGKMDRDEAKTRLGKEKDGTYLIRMSETRQDEGSFVVSVKSDNVEHFEIEQDFKAAAESNPFHAHLSLDGKTFESLVKVVDYLLTNPLKDGEQEIWCRTVCPGLPLNGVIVGYKKSGRR